MNVDVALLKADLARDEGLRLKPYEDTEGILTIGVGRNLEDVGISEDEAMQMLENDLQWVFDAIKENASWLALHPEQVQRAVANMCFNLGWPRLSQFKNMWTALRVRDYERAANEALDSRWARQVGPRALRIAEAIRTA